MTLAPQTVERAVATWRRWQESPAEGSLLSVVQIAGSTFVKAPPALHDRLGDLATRAFGAAHLSYADAHTLRAPACDGIVRIAPADARLARLRAVTDASEWSEAEVDRQSAIVTVAAGTSDALAAVAMVEDWFGLVGHIGVLTRADRRRTGLATAVAGAAARAALDRGLVPQWRARLGNDGSQRVAHRLGFETIGVQLFVRLPPPGSPTMEA